METSPSYCKIQDYEMTYSIEFHTAVLNLRAMFGDLEDYENLTTVKPGVDWKREGF